jgi:hypothetical protein
MREKLIEKLFNIKNNFSELCIDIFKYQYKNNEIYRKYCDLINQTNPCSIEEIPFLPISFFKTQDIVTQPSSEITFTSSGTTSLNTSKHQVYDLKIYERSFTQCFKYFYGDISNYLVLGLLPSYLDREGSSLIYMCEHMIQASKYEESSFFLRDYEKLYETINKFSNTKTPILLIGISYALLELAQNFNFSPIHNLTVMETGGTKGMKRDYTKSELHKILKNNLKQHTIHSEYGMTELLSQAYSLGDEIYECPPTMKIICSNINDSLTKIGHNQTGLINIIDLANIDSCSFIATEDLGVTLNEKQFKIMGRLDNSDIRGCNLLSIN